MLGYKGAQRKAHGPTRNIYSAGIVRTTSGWGEDGVTFYGENLILEVNHIEDKTVYGFVGGVDMKGVIFDLGLFVNYMTDFSQDRALSIRPHGYFSCFNWFNLDLVVEVDLYVIRPNFDYIYPWLLVLH